jgi:hypothetical protein
MTRLSLLEDQKAILTVKKEALESKRGDIYVREQKALGDALAGFYGVFPEDVEVEVTRGSVYFKMAHPEYSYKKELFSLYLRENWNFEEGKDKRSYTGIDLSYYTTSTKGVDLWELKRLQMLGKIAEVIYEKHDEIVDAANAAVLPFKEEYAEVYKEMQDVGSEIRGVENLITYLEKEKIEMDLKEGGVNFEKGRQIQLKFNYSPTVVSIRLTDVSKSGKTCTAVFKWAHGGNASQEEKVNVSSIIDQVHGLRKDIVQHTLAE